MKTTLGKAIKEIDGVMGRLTLSEMRIVLRALALVRRLSNADVASYGALVREAKRLSKRAGWSPG